MIKKRSLFSVSSDSHSLSDHELVLINKKIYIITKFNPRLDCRLSAEWAKTKIEYIFLSPIISAVTN